jgi:translocation and assembly module TamA
LARISLALFLLAACATPSQPFEGHPVLADIKFEGNNSISRSDLLSHITTAPTSGFFSKTVRYYDADLFAIDLKRIVRWYNEKGFYQAKILDVQELHDDAGRVTLVVKIDEGRRAVVRKQDLAGLDELPKNEVKDIDGALPIHPGDGFDEDVYEKAKQVLVEQLKEHGFAEAKVGGKVEVAPEDAAAHITVLAQPGKRITIGKVVVTGNRQIPADAIVHATGIDKGDRYSPSALELAQQRVYNLGTFSGVRVGLEPLGDSPVAAVRVNVREAPFHTVRFGFGLQAEETRWEIPRLRGEYTDRSLFGGLRRLELVSTVGYAFVNSSTSGAFINNPFNYDKQRSGFTTTDVAQLTVPSILLAGLDLINRAEFDREVQASYDYDEVAARIGLLYRRRRHSIAPSLNFVRYFLINVPGSQLYTAIGRSGTNAGIFVDCPRSCTLTYPEIRYTYDGRDNIIEPTEGFYVSLGLQQTLRPGNFSYFRLEPEVRGYLPFTKNVVLAGRFHYGALLTEYGNGASPFTQRFFFGGQNEQRGYAPLRQGPKIGANPVCDVTVTPGCQPYATIAVPVGGTSAVLVSGELRIRADWPIAHLGIVPFIDASRVGDDPRNPAAGGLEVAPGLGLRYLTPFGPIRLDVAWLLNPKDVTTFAAPDGSVLATRVSTHCGNDPHCISESRWAFHLTLGEAF